MHEIDSIKTGLPRHGGHLRAFAERFQIAENKILDFSSSVNPLPFPESLLETYAQCALELGAYPDPEALLLCEEITRHYPLQRANVLPGNGAVALIGLAIRALAPKRALVVEPSFTEYRRLLELQGAEMASIRLKEDRHFAFQFSEIMAQLGGADLLILGHPNSPTGTALAKEELLKLLAAARSAGVFVIVDEAFADWCPEFSVASALQMDSRFLVIRSLTKFYGLAGIRAGFALGPTEIIEAMKHFQDSWDINILAQKLSTAMLQETPFIQKTRAWFSRESRWLYQQLNQLEGFKAFPSLANFFLLKSLSGDAQEVFEFLGRRGIYIRLAGNYPGLNPAYLRVALRQRYDNERLIEALKDCAHS